MSSMVRYEYSPLDEEASEIRLMKLLPGRFRDRIYITLETTILTKTQVPEYEALSYAWGPKENPARVSIKTEITRPRSSPRTTKRAKIEHNMYSTLTLFVTRNLGTALRYLRRTDESRVLWIDAICVDQRNTKERNHQVVRMADVYSLASRVVVWLGPEHDDSAIAIKTLDEIGSQVQVDWNTQEITSDLREEVDLPTNVRDAITNLLSCSWFERLWVFQEVRLAKTVDVLCGDQLVPWDFFQRAILVLADMPEAPQFQHAVYRAFELGNYIPQSPLELSEALYVTRNCVCSDQRDKIYAVLSLIWEDERRDFVPDYSKSTQEVFQDVVLHDLERQGSLSLLTHCEMRKGPTSKPTWVPDWTATRTCSRILDMSACWGSQAQARYIHPGVLAATGVFVAKIKSVVDLPLDPMSMGDTEAEEMIRGLILTTFDSNFLECSNKVDALCRTLCGNVFAECTIPPTSFFPEFEQCREYLLQVIQMGKTTVMEVARPGDYIDRVTQSAVGRVLFTTHDGAIGLALKTVMPEDEVCILLGCETPLILRPDTAGYSQVVGECYIDGSMEGAALLGPLSCEWRRVSRVVSGFDGSWDAFVNSVTGDIQIEDPRLGPLPAGWRVGSHDQEEVINLYVNNDTGEETYFDPRMTPDALRARGVDIKEFQLV